MLTLQNILTITAVMAACFGLRALLHKFARCSAVMWVWYVAALWLAVNALPGPLPFQGSLWAFPIAQVRPALPPLMISFVKRGAVAVSSTAWLHMPSLLWLVGAVAVAAWLVSDSVRQGKKCTALLQNAAEKSSLLPLPKGVRLLQNELVAGPVSVGGPHPAILVPLEYDDLSAEQQTMVLVHELTHIKKRDTLFKLLMLVLTAVYWYHPLVWLMRSKLLLDMEYCCDEAVLDRCGGHRKQAYAQMLEQFAAGDIQAGAVAHTMSVAEQLTLRFLRMLRYHRPAPLHSVAALLLTLAAVAVLGTAAPLRQDIRTEGAAVQTEPGSIAIKTHPLLAGWTGWHAVPMQEATVYTNAGGPWQLTKGESAQMTLTFADSAVHDISMGYLDVARNKYVVLHTGSFENYVRVNWDAPYDGDFYFFLFSADIEDTIVQSFTVRS